jgi:hypothetical protein
MNHSLLHTLYLEHHDNNGKQQGIVMGVMDWCEGMMGDDEGQQANIGEWLTMAGENKGCQKMGNGGLKVKDDEGTMRQWHGTMGNGGFMTNQKKKTFFKEWMSDKGWRWGGRGDARC